MAKRMAALWQRAIGKMLLARAPQWQRCWLAGAMRRSCCRQGTVGTEDCRQGRCSEELSGRCCWPGRRDRAVAGREPSAQGTASRYAEAKSHREDAAGWGTVAELLARALRQNGWLARSAEAELLPATAGRHDKKKRVIPKPSWTCGSPSCLLTTCYGCLRFAII